MIAYDIRPEILSDFTTDRSKTQEALHRLTIPAFSEANLFDALTDTADRMSGIEGRKAILAITSGIDTFSKITYDQTRKKLQESGVPIYAIGLMQALREMMDSMGAMGPISRMDFLQADNQMRTFAKETGGQAYFPRFEGEFGSIFGSIHEALRNQYVLTYSPPTRRTTERIARSKWNWSIPPPTSLCLSRTKKASPSSIRSWRRAATKPRAPSSKVKNSISRFYKAI